MRVIHHCPISSALFRLGHRPGRGDRVAGSGVAVRGGVTATAVAAGGVAAGCGGAALVLVAVIVATVVAIAIGVPRIELTTTTVVVDVVAIIGSDKRSAGHSRGVWV